MLNVRSLLSIIVCLVCVGCVFKFDVPNQRTAYEKQLIGEPKEVDDQVLIHATSRAAGDTKDRQPANEGSISDIELVRLNRIFNRDDVEELKKLGYLGEANNGFIAVLPKKLLPGKPERLMMRLAALVVHEENRDRMDLWKDSYSKQASKQQFSSWLTKQRQRFWKDAFDQAQSGQWMQQESGEWIQVAAKASVPK